MAVELKDFIKTALADIVCAVQESQRELFHVASISPAHEIGSKQIDVRWADNKYSKVSPIEFDVAVTTGTSETNDGEISCGIKVLNAISVGIGGKNSSKETDETQTVSRIKFAIPVAFAPDVNLSLGRFCEKNQ